MLTGTVIVFKQILMLFLIIGVGFILGRRKLIDGSGMKAVTFLILNIALPCSVVRAFSIDTGETSLKLIGLAFGAAAFALLVLVIASFFLFRNRDKNRALGAHASDCIMCGGCEERCPFGVDVRQNMRDALKIFGY